MTRSEILQTAEKYVSDDRNSQYGEPEDNFKFIADFWSVYLDVKLDAYDVAMLMSLMKIARASRRPKNADSLIDLAGYAACAGEILSELPQNTRPAFELAAQVPPRNLNDIVKEHAKAWEDPDSDD